MPGWSRSSSGAPISRGRPVRPAPSACTLATRRGVAFPCRTARSILQWAATSTATRTFRLTRRGRRRRSARRRRAATRSLSGSALRPSRPPPPLIRVVEVAAAWSHETLIWAADGRIVGHAPREIGCACTCTWMVRCGVDIGRQQRGSLHVQRPEHTWRVRGGRTVADGWIGSGS